MQDYYSPPLTDRFGCGLLGCLVGLVLGLLGGGLLLILVSLISALTAPIPTPDLTTPPDVPNLSVSLDESFLNRFIDQPEAGSARVDIVPGNQFRVVIETTVEALGSTLPVEINGLFQLEVIGDRLEVLAVNTQVSGLASPPELSGFFNEDVAIINQNLGMVVDEMTQALGASAVSLQVRTDDAHIWLEVREGQ